MTNPAQVSASSPIPTSSMRIAAPTAPACRSGTAGRWQLTVTLGMSVRRWIGVAGIVVAVAGGTTATVRGRADAGYEAQVAVRLHDSVPKGVPFRHLEEPERLLDAPAVRELVRLRLGATPPLRVKPVTDDTILVVSRGATAQQAVDATTTYASSFVDVRRRQVEGDFAAAAKQIQIKLDDLQRQVDSAAEPQRASLVGAAGLFKNKLDQLHADHSARRGPEVAGSAPAEPVDDGTRWAWIVAALGAAVGIGAAGSGRRARRPDAG